MKELWNLYVSWFKMGLFTFGGGYAMLPMIQREVIQKYHWATEDEIMDYYAIGQITPGIIAVNTATFVGYKLRGVLGGTIATLGVISPSIIIISCIAGLIQNFSDLPFVQSALRGIQVAVCVLMTKSIINLYQKGVKNIPTFVIFAGACLLSTFTSISTMILVVIAGVCGYVMYILEDKKKEGENA